jgi:hypothetical protein
MTKLKIAGLIVLALWMAFITLEIEHTKNLAYNACAYASNKAEPPPDPHAFGCPDFPSGSYNPF